MTWPRLVENFDAAHGQELARHDLAGQVQHAEVPRHAAVVALAVLPEQDPRPDDRVEDDVVLAHEVVALGLRVGPPQPPGLGVAGPLRPLDRGGEVADHRVEPDVQPLHRLVAPALERDRHAPVDVAGDGARLELGDEVLAELEHVRPPVGPRLQPRGQGAGQRGQVEEEVLGLDELRRLAVDLGARVDEVDRVELVAAVVALVAARAAVAADRAGALDVAVGQRPAGRRADRAHLHARDDVAVAVQREEQLLHDGVVVQRRRPREEVVRQPEPLQVLDDDPVVLVRGLAVGQPLALGLDADRRAVLVGARHHEDVVAAHPHEAAEHVGGDTETGDVTDVSGAVRVRPGDSGQDASHDRRA